MVAMVVSQEKKIRTQGRLVQWRAGVDEPVRRPFAGKVGIYLQNCSVRMFEGKTTLSKPVYPDRITRYLQIFKWVHTHP